VQTDVSFQKTAHTFTAGSSADGPSGAFDSSLVVAGSSYEWKPTTAGSFPFYCQVHPWMTGLVVVNEISIVESSSVKSLEEPKVNYNTKSSDVLTPVNDTEFVNETYKNSEITSDAVKSMRILRIDSLENYVNMHSKFIDKDSTMKIISKYNDARDQITNEKYADVIKTLNSIDYVTLVNDPTISKELRIATNDVQASIGQATTEPISQIKPTVNPTCASNQKMNDQGECVPISGPDAGLFYFLAASAIIAAGVAFSVKKIQTQRSVAKSSTSSVRQNQ